MKEIDNQPPLLPNVNVNMPIEDFRPANHNESLAQILE